MYRLAADPWSEIVEKTDRKPHIDSFNLVDQFNMKSLAKGTYEFYLHLDLAIDEFRNWYYGSETNGKQKIAALDFKSLSIPTILGTICITGTSSDIHKGGNMLLLDLGGDDVYTGVNAAPLSLSKPIGTAIDLDGNDKYIAGCTPERFPFKGSFVTKRFPYTTLVTREMECIFSDDKFLIESESKLVTDEFLSTTKNWYLEVKDDVLLVWDKRDKKIQEMVNTGVCPEFVVTRNATRLGANIGSISQAAIDKFCCERLAFMIRTEPAMLFVYMKIQKFSSWTKEATPTLHLPADYLNRYAS